MSSHNQANDIIDNNFDSNLLPSIKNFYRLCHIVKRTDFDGYGFNLHSEKGKTGQYIGKVDEHSPAENAGLKEGDRIIEVNGNDIGNETHKQVVQRIKAISSEVRLLVIDPIKEKDILKQEKTVLSATAITTVTSTSTSPSSTTTTPTIINNNNGLPNINDSNDDNGTTSASIITVKSTKTTTTKDNISISSSSSVTSSPIINIKNNNNIDKDELQNIQNDYHKNVNGTSTQSPTPSFQTNVEFIINENTTIEQINNNNNHNHSNNNHNNNNNHQHNIVPDINNYNYNNNNNITDDNNENTIDKLNDNLSNIATSKNGNNSNNNNINNNNNNNNSNDSDNCKNNTTTTLNDDKKPSLNLPMTAAEMRAKLLAKKKYDPKNDSVDLRKKFEIIQKL